MILNLIHLLQSAMAQGSWDIIGQSTVVCIHTFVLPNNRLLCVERPHEGIYVANPFSNGFLSSEINLQNGADSLGMWQASARSIPIQNNPFCGGHAQMPDGSILMVGGDKKSVALDGDQMVVNGLRGVRVFKPCPPNSDSSCIGTWTIKQDMTSERWYPTVTTLADGTQIIVGGQKKNLEFEALNKEADDNPTYEYYPPKAGQWPKFLDILSWAYPHNMYAQTFLLPSENVYMLVSNRSIIINPKTDEIKLLDDMPIMDHSPWIYPHTPTMVVLPLTIANNFQFTLMICGGSKLSSQDASAMCMKISPDEKTPKWSYAGDMPNPRLMPDSVLLPDGKILFVNGLRYGLAGGNQGQTQYARDPVFAADLYDPEAPESGRWKPLAPATQMRLYHSGAVLLETGHVVTTGSEFNNYYDYWPESSRKQDCFPAGPSVCTDPFNYNIERFTPPYLANATNRPVIVNAPAQGTYGSLIEVELDATSKVKRITFVRTSTTTHSTNTDQRFVELVVEAKSSKKLYIRLPSLPGKAPPGNWFLWALDQDGVPSVAKIVNLAIGPVNNVAIPPDANAAYSTRVSIFIIAFALCLS